MSLKGNWNLRAGYSWYIHHEAYIHSVFERHFLQPLIPVRNPEFKLEM